MITKLKYKIFIGVLLIAVLLTASAGMVLYQFITINKSIGALLDDNYKSIQSCQSMAESLEREDSGVLLLLMGKGAEGRSIILKADSTFAESLKIAEKNLSEQNEERYVNKIKEEYAQYRILWALPLTDSLSTKNIEWYSNEVNPAFLEAKGAVNELLALNQIGMYSEASLLEQKIKQAIMPAIVSIVAVILFAFIFNFFLSQSFIVPLRKLIEATRYFNASQANFNPKIKANDEFKELENNIHELIVKINRHHKES